MLQTHSELRRVAVVGADGFIGRHLARRLADLPGIEPILIARRFRDLDLGGRWRSARFVQADMSAPEASQACVGAAAVVDLVASESPQSMAGSSDAEIAAIAALHREFYDRLGRNGARHVLVLSSGGTVYGRSDAPLIAEDHPTRPLGNYGRAKLLVEQELQAAAGAGGFGFTVLRPSNCYGPGQSVKRRQGLLAAVLRCYESGQPLQVAGDGSNVRDYIFVDDLVDAIVSALDAPHGAGGPINIGSGRGTSILQLIDLFAAIVGRRLDVAFGPPNAFDVPRNVLDISKAARLLGWSPKIELECGIRRLLATRAA
jgi:UDP-glucose 4-epimerase